MISEDLYNIYISRPFKTRNADEYDLENILDLFIDPTEGLIGPFDYSSSIIKGRMGSGKTMYLRANYAYYLYTLVPCLLENSPIILPVYIKLSDFQNISDPEKIYYAIIIKIIEEIVSVCVHLRSAEELARLHKGANTITGLWSTDKNISHILGELKKYTCEEYVEKIDKSFKASGSISAKFLDTCTSYSKNQVVEMKRCDKPSFQNIVDTCKNLLDPFDGKLLILFDEVGSINKKFFKSTKDTDSYFEILMNQLRTLSYVRVKMAVYPNSDSDILKETRYGETILLDEDILNGNSDYTSFLSKTTSLIERYIYKSTNIKCKTEDVFDVSTKNQLLLEQLVNASGGNMRRLVYLLESCMNEAFSHNHGLEKVQTDDVMSALRAQGLSMESKLIPKQLNFVESLAKLCKSRSTFKFTLPNNSTRINKLTNISNEYNILNIIQYGTGRRSSVYAFDYAYCVYKELPTHYIKNSEKIDKSRSSTAGEPISRIAQLTNELIFQSNVIGKIDGEISFLGDNSDSGFIKGVDGVDYFFSRNQIIKTDRKKSLFNGEKVKFKSTSLNQTPMASEIELLS